MRYYGLYFLMPHDRWDEKIVGIFAENLIKKINDYLLNKIPIGVGGDFEPISEEKLNNDRYMRDRMRQVAWILYNPKRPYKKYKYRRENEL